MNPVAKKLASLLFYLTGGVTGSNVSYVLVGPVPDDMFAAMVWVVLFVLVTWTVTELIAITTIALHEQWWEKRNIK